MSGCWNIAHHYVPPGSQPNGLRDSGECRGLPPLKGRPTIHAFLQADAGPLTVCDSCLGDKNPPSIVCWRGLWLNEQAAFMCSGLLQTDQARKKKRAEGGEGKRLAERFQFKEKTLMSVSLLR